MSQGVEAAAPPKNVRRPRRSGLALEVTDINGSQRQVHIRDGKGGKGRYVPPAGHALLPP